MDFASTALPMLGKSRKIADPITECKICRKKDHFATNCPLRAEFEKQMPKRVQPMHHVNVLKVTNLSQDTKDHDVLELFREFNPTRCLFFIVKSSGIAFVHLPDNDQAEKSMQKLNGSVFMSQAIEVVWIFVKGTPRQWG